MTHSIFTLKSVSKYKLTFYYLTNEKNNSNLIKISKKLFCL